MKYIIARASYWNIMSETFQSTFYNGTIQNITYMACMPPKICYWSQCNTYTIKSLNV